MDLEKGCRTQLYYAKSEENKTFIKDTIKSSNTLEYIA